MGFVTVTTKNKGVVTVKEIDQSEINKIISPRQWPLILLPIKAMAQPGDAGLGDIIERVIGPIGGNEFKAWYAKLFGKPCGCEARKDQWNARYPL